MLSGICYLRRLCLEEGSKICISLVWICVMKQGFNSTRYQEVNLRKRFRKSLGNSQFGQSANITLIYSK